MSVTASDRHRAKLVVLFCALGMVSFLLNLLAGAGLWSYASSRAVEVPTYDRFVGELRATDESRLPLLAKSLFEKWHACETSRSGMGNVALHAMITFPIVAIVLFTLCFVLGLQLLRNLDSIDAARSAPQPPDPVDDTWR